MIDRNSKSEDDTRRHIEESLASGRITRFEADIIASFLNSAIPGVARFGFTTAHANIGETGAGRCCESE